VTRSLGVNPSPPLEGAPPESCGKAPFPLQVGACLGEVSGRGVAVRAVRLRASLAGRVESLPPIADRPSDALHVLAIGRHVGVVGGEPRPAGTQLGGTRVKGDEPHADLGAGYVKLAAAHVKLKALLVRHGRECDGVVGSMPIGLGGKSGLLGRLHNPEREAC
jgi:hypothetical protein